MSNQKRTQLECTIQSYWQTSKAIKHPQAPALSTGDALHLLADADKVVLDSRTHNIVSYMNELRCIIIEGEAPQRNPLGQKAQVLQLQQSQGKD